MDLKKILQKVGNITIEKTDMDLPCSFTDFAHCFSELKGTCVLLSGGELDCARYNILSFNPFMTIKTRYGKCTLKVDDEEFQLETDPFELLSLLLSHFKMEESEIPVASGMFGYLSYDLKDMIEKLPRTSVDDLHLPHIFLTVPSGIIINDRKENVTKYICVKRDGQKREFIDPLNYYNSNIINSNGYCAGEKGLFPNFTKKEYENFILDIKDYIGRGHVYQVNMSQRFRTDFKGDPFSLFKEFFRKNPAPFFSFINCYDHFVVSTSPERFITRDGDMVETRPIKGTRPRGKTIEEDRVWENDLVTSTKDDAELSMIVDLLRNDIGKVCRGNSVIVKEHKKVEAYENVYHLVSIIEGVLSDECDSADLIKATFPGGSITGCPKIRSMEIIDELETVRRHIYTGSVGYISFHDTMDFSIAIRTALIKDDALFFSVGGAIVYDSDPKEEYEETIHKGKTFFDAIRSNSLLNPGYMWINGKITEEARASVSPLDPGFQYGSGFFETILYDRGEIRFLDDHIERFNRSSEKFIGRVSDFTWKDVIELLIEKNGLKGKTCAVKIMALKGGRNSAPFNDTFIVTIREYLHRLKSLNKSSLDIGIYENPRFSFLSDYKTMNCMHLYEAGKWARSNGYDEAVILNPDLSISETNTANIIFIKGKEFFLPDSPHYLKGTMEKTVCEHLHKMGYIRRSKKIFFKDICENTSIILTNSLMGVVPVSSVNGKNILISSNLCPDLNNMLDFTN